MTAPIASSTLGVNVFTAPGKAMVGERPKPFGEAFGFDPMTSTLIFGEYDAVLVDAMTTVAEAEALADWIALHTATCDHLYNARSFRPLLRFERAARPFPGRPRNSNGQNGERNAACFCSPPWAAHPAGAGLGRLPRSWSLPSPMRATRSPSRATNCASSSGPHRLPLSTSLHVPSIDLIVAGDVVYNQCHMYVGDTTPESRKNWIAALDRLAALNPTMVVAGHKKPGAPDSPSTIQDTKRYLQDFDRLQKTATSEQELFDQMTELYPHWVANQSWLMFGFPQP